MRYLVTICTPVDLPGEEDEDEPARFLKKIVAVESPTPEEAARTAAGRHPQSTIVFVATPEDGEIGDDFCGVLYRDEESDWCWTDSPPLED